METNIQIFTFEGTDIEFEISSKKVMVNATEMAKPFGKLPAHFLANQQIWDFIDECCKDENYYKIFGSGYRNSDIQTVENGTSESGNSHLEVRKLDFVRVTKGGAHQGTWMHRLIALKFAQWLNPAFDLWCIMIIDEILQRPIKKLKETTNEVDRLQQQFDTLKQKLSSEEDFVKFQITERDLKLAKKRRSEEFTQPSFNF